MASSSRRTSPRLFLVLLLLVESPALLVALGLLGGAGTTVGRLGQAAALAALGLLVLLPFLPARLRMLSNAVGQERLMKVHGLGGLLLLLLLPAHVVMMNMAGLVPGPGSTDPSWALPLGQVGALIAFAAIFGAMFRNRLPVDYGIWRMGHRSIVLLTFLVAGHAFGLGDHFEGRLLPAFFGLLLLGLAFLSLYRRVWTCWKGGFPYEIDGIVEETHDVRSLLLRPLGESMPAHRPGQFAFFTMAPGGGGREDHPFSLSAPTMEDDRLQVTIKGSGDFSSRVARSKVGDPVSVEGPFGEFGDDLADAPSFLFIAGGVGLTPLMAMLSQLVEDEDERRGCLILALRSEEDRLFSEQLEKLPSNWTKELVLSRPGADWKGPSGHLDSKRLEELAGELLGEARVYLCGPPAMMDTVTKALASLGVSTDRIRSERFSLL